MLTPDPAENEFLEGLDLLGAPIFVLSRAAAGTPPTNLIRGLYRAPSDWSKSTSKGNTARLNAAKPGDAYGTVCGHTYDVLDIDPRNGGTESFKLLVASGAVPQVHRVVSTPRGGFHLYIDPLGAGKHTGFLPGADLQAAGTFVFIPPTEGYTELAKEDWPYIGVPGKSSGAKLADFALRRNTPVLDTTSVAPSKTVIPAEVVQDSVAHTLQLLDALKLLEDGARLPWPGVAGGVGWDIGGLYAAERLVEASNSGTAYSRDDAKADFLAHSPVETGTYDPEHKWDQAVKYVGTKALPYTSPTDDFGSVIVDIHSPSADYAGGEIHSGQIRMAYRFASMFKGKMLWVHGVGWHYWDSTRWAEDTKGNAERAVMKVLQEALKESVGGDKKLRTDVTRCESATGIKGVLSIAATLEEFAYTAEQMDEDPYLVNCANGTLDLRDRVLRPHNPDDKNTKLARGAYDPSLDKSAWRTFLEQVLPDEDERNYFQRVIGQAVYGGVREHLFPVLTGTGANGKGTAYGAICSAFGDYATVINPDMLMVHDRGGVGGPEMMVLRGARLVVASELGKDRTLDDSLMKRLTGGDKLTARHLFKEPVTWTPTHQLVYVSNHKPKTQGDDAAVWRRMRIIPFNVVIPEAERDMTLGETLSLYSDAIFTWAVEGFFDHEDNGGMREPAAVLKATERYQHENDDIARFIEDRCDTGRALSVSVAELWIAWLTWRDEEGCEILSKRAFGMAIDKRGFTSAYAYNVKVRKGLSLKSREDSTE